MSTERILLIVFLGILALIALVILLNVVDDETAVLLLP